MTQMRVQRRLASILAADVAGDSRLQRSDESGTCTRLEVLRSKIFDPIVT